MIDPILQTIVKNKKPVYFISPHFDDAVLSAGALLSYLAGKTPITVVNLFTQAEKGASTLSAKAFLQQCGYTDQQALFSDREKEDAAVLENVSDMVINLGHTDALWRKKPNKDLLALILPFIPEAHVLYPTYRFHISKGKIASSEKALITTIKQELRNIVREKDAVIFCPFGVGNHIDHVLTRKICEELFSAPIYWSDFPYNQNHAKQTARYQSFSFDEYLDKKEKLAKGYKTQYQAMFANGFPKTPETFFIKQ